MCDTLKQWLTRLESLLYDKEGITWTAEDKTEALNLAIAAVAAYMPDAYTRTIEHELVAGEEQKLPSGVSNIIGDIRTVCKDKDGTTTTLSPVKKGEEYENVAFKFFGDKRCVGSDTEQKDSTNTCSKWALTSWTYDSRSPTRLIVSPPVPNGAKSTIKLTVAECPTCLTYPADLDKELPCGYRAEITDYALSVLYSMPQENEQSLSNSVIHRKQYMDGMAVHYKAASRLGSGYYKGREGSGDPMVVR